MNSEILAKRLHHTAYVTKDLEATRAFYEDVLGFPLMATYCEKDELFGKERTYCHCFFELADGSALAFFQFADPDDQAEFGPEIPESPFIHIALQVDEKGQAELERRISAAGFVDLVSTAGAPRSTNCCSRSLIDSASISNERQAPRQTPSSAISF